jgi:uncharacterized membrane protein SpoIIM required for sporulation
MASFKQMDLDAYTAAHRDEWDRLARLGRSSRLSGDEADGLIDAYQSGATDLSVIQSTMGQSLQGDRLALHLSRARQRFTGVQRNVLSRLPEFFIRQAPATLYRIRWVTVAVAFATFLVAAIYYVWLVNDPRALATIITDEDAKKLATEDFYTYYSENSQGSFAALVWSHNAFIALQCVVLGIVGFYVPSVMLQNAQNLGMSAAVLAKYDRLGDFFLYISPHGQLELYSLFVAAAAGLAIFWSVVRPGKLSRLESLAAGGRSLVTVAVVLAISLLVTGFIEGFITRLDWPWVIKIGIGSVVFVLFLIYQWGVGRVAVRNGETGDLEEFEAGARRLTTD